jgi:hypothetical protein
MSDLTYRGVEHHGSKEHGPSKDALMNYRGASHHSADMHKGKPKASRAGLFYRGVPQH